MSKKSTENRRIVLEMLMETDALLKTDIKKDTVKEHVLLTNVLNKYDYLERQDKAFITYLFEGVVRNRIKLDYIIANYAKVKGKMKPLVRNILRMGIFQIIYMDSVPDSAACNESVNLMIDRGLSGVKGFVNGVVRTVAREKENITWPSKDNKIYYLSVFYSMPEWIVEYLISNYGEEKAELILKKTVQPAEVTIRLNTLDDNKADEIINSITQNGNILKKHDYLNMAYKLSKIDSIEYIPAFAKGDFTIQDVSSQLAIYLLPIMEGDSILDLCSAPGGKAAYAALKTGENGHVDARDISEYKLDSILENAQRLSLNNITVGQWDATVLDETIIDKYDFVIVDAPCSGLGVMGKKSDIKYNVTFDSVKELSKLQKRIIDNAVKYVKKGGILVYSTCTLTKEENDENRKYILSKGEFSPFSFEDRLPDALKNQGGADGYLQLLQGVHDCDGFYISIYKRS